VFVDKLATVVPMSDNPVESEPKPDAELVERLVMLAVLLASPVDSDAKDCEAVVDSAASPEDTPATPVALLAVAVDSDVTD
jgi:hypothetical protein